MKEKVKIKLLYYTVISLLISIIIMSISAEFESKKVADNVLRLHIVANSDTYVDQDVKLKIRDNVLLHTKEMFGHNANLSEAIKYVSEELETLNLLSNNILLENGFNYTANTKIEKTYFPTKVYDNIILPAGTYNAVKIKLGDAKGKNWWCMLFPVVCVPNAIKRNELLIEDALLKEGSITNIEKTPKGKIRFRIVEIISSIFNK